MYRSLARSRPHEATAAQLQYSSWTQVASLLATARRSLVRGHSLPVCVGTLLKTLAPDVLKHFLPFFYFEGTYEQFVICHRSLLRLDLDAIDGASLLCAVLATIWSDKTLRQRARILREELSADLKLHAS